MQCVVFAQSPAYVRAFSASVYEIVSRHRDQFETLALIANINLVFYVISVPINTLTERFHRNEKILTLSLSFVCLPYTFENKKGIINIIVDSSVIDINKIEWFFLHQL